MEGGGGGGGGGEGEEGEFDVFHLLTKRNGWMLLCVLWGIIVVVAGVGILKEFLYEKWLERMGRDSWSFEESYLMESSGRPFHLIFFFITLFKFASALLSFPSCSLGPIFPQPCASFFFALSDGVFFLFLFLFSGGWGLLSPLSLDLVRQSFCYLLMVFFFFCSFLSIDAKVSLFLLHIFLPPLVYSLLNKNTTTFRFRVLWFESIEDRVEEQDHQAYLWNLTSLSSKLHVFSFTQFLVSTHLFSYLLITFCYIFFLFEDEIYLLLLQLNSGWFTGVLWWLVRPERRREGLFWAGDGEGWGEWEWGGGEMGEMNQINAMRYHQKLVTKDLCLVQFPKQQQQEEQHQGEEIQEERGEEGEKRNVYLGVAMKFNLDPCLPEERDRVEEGEE